MHPIRPFRQMVNEILKGMDVEFDRLYADSGRFSIEVDPEINTEFPA